MVNCECVKHVRARNVISVLGTKLYKSKIWFCCTEAVLYGAQQTCCGLSEQQFL